LSPFYELFEGLMLFKKLIFNFVRTKIVSEKKNYDFSLEFTVKFNMSTFVVNSR
jgi:hypothetical protein